MKHKFDVIYDDKGEKVELHLDNEGIDFLIEKLQELKTTKNDHLHLMTPAWGGNELSENENSLNRINHLKIFKWD